MMQFGSSNTDLRCRWQEELVTSKLSPVLMEFLKKLSSCKQNASQHQLDLKDVFHSGESWESMLSVLMKDSVTELNGTLAKVPIFLTMSPLLQNRFLFLLYKNKSSIPRIKLAQFLEKISHEKASQCSWTKFWIRKLNMSPHHVAQNTNLEENDEKNLGVWIGAEDNLDVRNLYQQTLQKLSKTCQPSDVDGTDDRTRNGSGPPQQDLNEISNVEMPHVEPMQHESGHDKTVDVIIIDSEEEEIHFPETLEYLAQKQPLASLPNPDKQLTVPSVDEIRDKTFVLEEESGSKKRSLEEMSREETQTMSINKVQKKSDKALTINSESKTKDNISKPKAAEEIISIPADNDRKTHQNEPCNNDNIQTNEKHGLLENNLCQDGSERGEFGNEFMKTQKGSESLPSEIKVRLSSMKEVLSSPSHDVGRLTEFWQCLKEMNPQQIVPSCDYVGLSDVPEESLVPLMDSLCQVSFDLQHLSAVIESLLKPKESLVPLMDSLCQVSFDLQHLSVIIESSLKQKLLNLTTHASHHIEAAMTTIVKKHPTVVIDFLIEILVATNAGEYQCHLVQFLCQQALPKPALAQVISKLSIKGLPLNNHLIQVLQVCVNSRCDLDPASSTSFVNLLCQASDQCCQDAKFGQLMLAFVTKYGEKICPSDATKLQLAIQAHTSSFKKALIRTISKLTQ